MARSRAQEVPVHYVALLVVLFVSSLAASAAAQSSEAVDAAAQAHFRSGSAYFDTGNYEGALREFREAYTMSQRPALLYNIYLAEERLGNLAAAIEALDGFLTAVPDEPRHETLTLRLATMRARLAEQGPAPAETEATAAPAPPAEDGPTSSAFPTSALVSFIAAGAFAVTFGVFGALALAEDSSLADQCGADAGKTCSDDDLSTLGTYALVADIGLAGTVLASALGVVLVITAGEDGEAVAIRPSASPHALGVSASGSF